MIKYVTGDLFNSKANIIAHGVNCAGGFGSGIAGQIAKLHPEARSAYLTKFINEGWALGDVQFVYQEDVIIANCATQKAYLPRTAVNVNYDAVRTTMQKVKEFAMSKGLTVAAPKIGAGLAGGDWPTIEKILNEVFQDYDISVYVLE